MMYHLPALLVIIPLLAAPIVVLIGKSRVAWLVTLIAFAASFAVSISLLITVLGAGEAHYFMGGWAPPVGVAYRVDLLNAFVLLLVSGSGFLMMPFALHSVASEVPAKKQALFYAMYLLCFAGLLGITITDDIFNLYVFLEISSLATYTLIALGNNRKALTAAFEYLILGTLGATFILIGIGFLYMITGTLNITDMAGRVHESEYVRPVFAALAFLTLGLVMKIAMFPVHGWLANAYTYSPSVVSAFLSATATKVSVYVLIRILFTLFGWEFSFMEMPLELVLIVLAVAGILFGSVFAIYEPNVKRRLAFSSVAQLGYVVLGIGLATQAGLAAGIAHLFNHALAKGALFIAMGTVLYATGGVRIEDMKGLGKYMPWTFAGFVIAGLSLIGIPGTAGFVSKWYFLQALIEKGMWPLLIVIILSSLMAVVYIGQVLEVVYFGKRSSAAVRVKKVPFSMHLSLWTLVVLSVWFGFDTRITLDIAIEIAYMLMGGTG
jgi:multicomponent Na+:H+ antiporter subunit D